MKYRSCSFVLKRLAIGYDDLSFCAHLENKVSFLENFCYTGKENIVDIYLQKRQEFINKNKESFASEKCLSCPNYILNEWDETPGINHLYIATRTFCSCNCIYCYIANNGNQDIKKVLNTQKPWDIIAFLKEFEQRNLITDDCYVIISGGNPEEFPKKELQWLIDFGTKKNRCIEILTAGIFYSKEIENALKERKNVIVNISPDSGTKETYEKIKQVKCYDKVWENIKKYKSIANTNNNNDVLVKYILINGVNDTDEEINAFFEKCKDANIKKMKLEIDFYFTIEFKNKLMPSRFLKALRTFLDKENVTIYNKDLFKTTITVPSFIYNENIIAYLKYFMGKLYIKFESFEDIDWTNFKCYLSAAKDNKEIEIIAQYIIKDGINNSEAQINNFTSKCAELGFNNIEFKN